MREKVFLREQKKEAPVQRKELEHGPGIAGPPPAFNAVSNAPRPNVQTKPNTVFRRPLTPSGGEGGETELEGGEGETDDLETRAREVFNAEDSGQGGAEEGNTDPPHSLVPANEGTRARVSTAVKDELQAVVDTVQELTGQDLGSGFGDTTRPLGSLTSKDGADNFSWHKSGRAVDFDQRLPWVIVEDPSGGDMYFRLFFKATQQAPAEQEAPGTEGETPAPETQEGATNNEGSGTSEGEWKHPSPYARKFTREADGDSIHHNGVGNALWTSWMIDVTTILAENGYERIPAHSGWESRYNRREWWHYVKDDGLSWYEALAEIYSREDLVAGVRTFATHRHRHAGRLSREGFPDDVLKDVWGNTPITKNGFSLHFSVGGERNCANIAEDVAAVRTALTTLGVAPNADIAAMISAYQAQIGMGNPDGYITVGGGTHGAIGRQLP